jgi:hypothetical protein
MTAIANHRRSSGRRALLIALACLPLAALAPVMARAELAQEAPGTAPKDPRLASPGKRPGETLSEQLDRNNGVIHPPAGTDPGIAVPAPNPGPQSTPVIPPPGTPGGNPSPQPK